MWKKLLATAIAGAAAGATGTQASGGDLAQTGVGAGVTALAAIAALFIQPPANK